MGRYRYDAGGRRVERSFENPATGSTEQVFYVCHGAQEIEELGPSGNLVADYAWGGQYIDQLVQMRRDRGAGLEVFYAHSSSIFTLHALTDASGQVVERYRYTSIYGEHQVLDGGGGARAPPQEIGNPWRFQGRRLDPETGLLFFRLRYLDPALGRFVSRDPLGPWGDPRNRGNSYAFCGCDPVNCGDPWGLENEPLPPGVMDRILVEAKRGGWGAREIHDRVNSVKQGRERAIRAGLRERDFNPRPLGPEAMKHVAGDVAVSAATGDFRDAQEFLTAYDLYNERPLTLGEWGCSALGVVIGSGVAWRAYFYGSSRVTRTSESAYRSARGDSTWYHAIDDATAPVRRGNADTLVNNIESKGYSVTRGAQSTRANPGLRALEVRSGATRVQILEEWIHLRQPARSQKSVARVQQDLLQNHPVGCMGLEPGEFLAVAEEVHAKAFLLNNAKLLGLGKIDRWVLRKQLERLRTYGRSRGY